MSQSFQDFDFNTDGSTRIARRVAHGVYRLTHAEQEIGEEVWGIFALRSGGYRLMTEIDLQWPVAHQQRAHLDVDDRWAVKTLWAQIDLNNTRRMATYTPVGPALDIEVVETNLHADEHIAKRRGRKMSAAGMFSDRPDTRASKSILQQRIAFSPTAHLDFASALFNFIALQRLHLQKQARATFEAIVLSLPTLEPLLVKQTYCYEDDEPLQSHPSGAEPVTKMTRRHTITEMSASTQSVTTFWTDANGIVLKQELQLADAPHACEMVSYQWQG